MRSKQRSLAKQRRPGSATWYENFTVQGHRFRRSLETDDRETAEILAAKTRSDALLGKLTGKKQEHTLTQALARYRLEHGQHLPSKDDIRRIGLVLQDPKQGLGKGVFAVGANRCGFVDLGGAATRETVEPLGQYRA